MLRKILNGFRVCLGCAVLLVASAGSTYAQGPGRCLIHPEECPGDLVGGAPEIDPGTMASAFSFLIGGYLLMSSRLRRK